MKFIVQEVRVLEVEAETREEALERAQKTFFWANKFTVAEDHPLAELKVVTK